MDACPNDNLFTRLPFYDDSATLSGPPNDQPIEYQTNRVLEIRDNREIRSTRGSGRVRVSRSELGRAVERRDSRLAERRDDRRSRQTRDSRSLERDSVVERRNDQRRSQQIRLSRSLERDSVDRYSRTLADRYTTDRRRLSERRTERLGNSERDSTTARRDARLSERRNDRRSNERDSSARAFRKAVEVRVDERRRQTLQVRTIQRDSSAGNSRLTSERRNRNTRSTTMTRNAEFFDERRSIERDSRLRSERGSERVESRRIRGLRSLDRDSAARNSKLVAERRDARFSERRDERRTQRARLAPVRNSRVVTQGESEREIRDTRDRRGIAERRNSRDTERREERLNRRVREHDSRTRNTERRDLRISERRVRDSRSMQRSLASRSLHSTTERRENRVNDGIRDAKSSERDLTRREARSVSDDRRVRSLRSTTVRNARERFVTRNERSLNARHNSEGFDSRRYSVTERRNAENRLDRSTRLRQSIELRQVRENLMKNDRLERRESRLMGEKSSRRDRDSRVTTEGSNRDRSYRRSRESISPAAIRDEETREIRDKRVTRGTGLMFDKLYTEQLHPSTAKYQGLRQTAILILCAVYGASLFGQTGKGSISG